MQDKRQDLFEYAVIRIVPRVEREEFLNAGVILYCKDQKFLGMRYEINEARLSTFYCLVDRHELEDNLMAFEKICAGGKQAGAIGALSMPERFRWLTAARSTVVQTSRVHPGLCEDARVKLDALFDELVRTGTAK